ncbi:hypothetical protein [Leifsonia poae]|uniref:hypothetical protein n=1 Tax=Leifsonia poae TaxID=110933 RepID=UPI003D66EE5C
MPTLQEQRATLLDQARTIIDGAKDRDLTDAEQTQATAYLDQVSGLDASIKASERSGAIIHKFENAYSPDSADQDGPAEFGSKHLSLRGVPAKAFSAFRPAGSKAVISTGSVVLGTELLPAIQPGSRARCPCWRPSLRCSAPPCIATSRSPRSRRMRAWWLRVERSRCRPSRSPRWTITCGWLQHSQTP